MDEDNHVISLILQQQQKHCLQKQQAEEAILNAYSQAFAGTSSSHSHDVYAHGIPSLN